MCVLSLVSFLSRYSRSLICILLGCNLPAPMLCTWLLTFGVGRFLCISSVRFAQFYGPYCFIECVFLYLRLSCQFRSLPFSLNVFWAINCRCQPHFLVFDLSRSHCVRCAPQVWVCLHCVICVWYVEPDQLLFAAKPDLVRAVLLRILVGGRT